MRDALPEKMEGTSTIEEVVSRTRRDEKSKFNLSATAAIFVPRHAACAAVANVNSDKTSGDVLGDETIARLDWAAPEQGQSGDNLKPDEEANTVDDTETITLNQEIESKSCDAEEDDFGKFIDVELSPPAVETMKANGNPDSSCSVLDVTARNGSNELCAKVRPSYDDLMTLWAIEDSKDKLKPTRTCFWNVATLFTSFKRGT
ncbi:hypothetical protein NPX13_g7179 [Xylaria arbuscula]|uniref:Uncharacterized protein n=1 Tax=Xylaria arbuscula TaxID=114810 RepID=A0A9W8NBF5_9PEZI|nr:hypothetical protein NPX13_g7179 [Xylaria arbuscula]